MIVRPTKSSATTKTACRRNASIFAIPPTKVAMALSIKDEKADRLARELARRTGETLTEAVTRALEERLQRVAPRKRDLALIKRLNEIAKACAALSVLDDRPADEILGYDENGLPT